MQEAVEAVTHILGMATCEGTDAVPPNARSHTLLLSGSLIGGVQVTPHVLGLTIPTLSSPNCWGIRKWAGARPQDQSL